MRIRGSKTPPLNSSSALPASPTPSPSPPSNSPSSNDSSSRCEGLDLLVLAVIEVNGGKALDAEKNAINGVKEEEEDRIEKREDEKGSEFEVGLKPKRRRRQLAMPSRYQDSVLQPLKRQTRRRPIGAK